MLAPARKRQDGHISLEPTPGGFATPALPDGTRLRVEGDELLTERVDDGAVERRERLEVDRDAALALGDFYELTAGALRRLAVPASPEVKLWPEHFDAAIDLGDEAAGLRATFGGSPGDENHAEPYLYVTPWTARPAGPLWNAVGFPGAELPYAELAAAADSEAEALRFFSACKHEIEGG